MLQVKGERRMEMKCIGIMLAIIFFIGLSACDLSPIEDPQTLEELEQELEEYYDSIDPEPNPFVSFDSVSQYYLNTYGQPEEVSTFTSGSDYTMIDWWYWTKGFEVTFANTPYDDTNGWSVDSTYTFDPIN